jgi:polar amino acid transport system substrate-binding protein
MFDRSFRINRRQFGLRMTAIGAAMATGLHASQAAGQTLDALTLITEDYPPFNFERNGNRQGIAVDLLMEMLELTGSKKSRADIRVWPWARGYETALKEKDIVLFSTTRTEPRENLFKWVGPIMPSRIVLIARKKNGIRLASVEELGRSGYRIGVVREDVGEKLLDKVDGVRDKVVLLNSGISVAKMLQANRVDLWAYDIQVAMWNLKELGYDPAEYEEVFTLAQTHSYYFALSKKTDDKVVSMLQSALDQIKSRGRLNEIVARYRRSSAER